MDFTYIVKIKVRDTVYNEYKRWLQHHVEGNSALGIKGMMDIQHQGRFIFPSVEIYTTDPIVDFHLLTVRYYTDDIRNIDHYMEHYAPEMRGCIPTEFHPDTSFNRFVDTGRSVRPLGEIDHNLEVLFELHEDRIYNLASFEIYR